MLPPFRERKVDEDVYRDLIKFQIENGASAIVPCGTRWESAILSIAKHNYVIDIAIPLNG